MAYTSNNAAMEGIFDPEMTTNQLLESVRAKVKETINTVEAAADLENKLSEEAASFNKYLNIISNCMRMVEQGEMTREDAKDQIGPAVTALKTQCQALKLTDVAMADDDLSENEIAMLREYIVGCKDIVAARKEELQDSPADTTEASEGVMSYLNNMEIAEEGGLVHLNTGLATMSDPLRSSAEAKTANELYKNAKKIYRMGSKEKAIDYMKKAKNNYQKCLDKAMAYGSDVKTRNRNARNPFTGSTVEKTRVATTYDKGALVAYFEDRIDSCDTYLQKWTNGNDKRELKEIKKQIKADRKAKKAQEKAARKAAKEAWEAEQAEGEEIVSAMEGLIAALEAELAFDMALEADGAEAGADAQSMNIIQKAGSAISEGFRKFGGLFKKGDAKGADAVEKEILKATDEFDGAAKDVEANGTEDQKKKVKKTVAIIVGAIVIALVAVGLVALAKKTKPMAEGETRWGNLKGLIKSALSAIKRAFTNPIHDAQANKAGRLQDKAVSMREEAKRSGKGEYVDYSAADKAQARADKYASKHAENIAESDARRMAAGREAAQNKRDSAEGNGLKYQVMNALHGGKGPKKKGAMDSFMETDGILAWLASEGTGGLDQFDADEDCPSQIGGDAFDENGMGENMTEEEDLTKDGEDLGEDAVESYIYSAMLEDNLDPDEFN